MDDKLKTYLPVTLNHEGSSIDIQLEMLLKDDLLDLRVCSDHQARVRVDPQDLTQAARFVSQEYSELSLFQRLFKMIHTSVDTSHGPMSVSCPRRKVIRLALPGQTVSLQHSGMLRKTSGFIVPAVVECWLPQLEEQIEWLQTKAQSKVNSSEKEARED